MSDIRTQLEHWQVGMTQAQRFAARDNYFEAVGRLEAIGGEIDTALAAATDAKVRGRLERLRFQVTSQIRELSAKHAAWNARIAAIRDSHLQGAAEEMRRPLPNPVD